MPYLKAILVNLKDKAKRMLRAKAMKCSSLVGMVVGTDKFIDDAKQVMEVFISLQGAQMKTNDPTTSYMLQLGVISKRARQKSYVFPFPNSVRVCCCRHGPGYVSVWVRISFRICSCCASFASVCSTET